MRARALPIVLALAAPACIIDLGGLTSGGTGGGATSSSSASSSGTAFCSVLQCGCVEGPTAIASGQATGGSPRGVAVTSDGVYWTSDTGIQLFAAMASGPSPVVDAEGARALSVAGDAIAWTASDGVHACTLPSCADHHQVTASTASDSLTDVAFDGQTVAFADVGTGSQDGLVAACAVSGCSPISLSSNLYAPSAVTFVGTSAFFVDQGNGNQNGSVARSTKTGQSLSQIAASRTQPSGVAADDTYVYWTEEIAGGHVYRCAYAAGYCDNPEDIAPAAGGLARPHDIRVGGGRIYWTTRDDGRILSCPQPGCGSAMPTVHATGRQGIERLAIGTTCLFWTEDGDGGQVVKAPL